MPQNRKNPQKKQSFFEKKISETTSKRKELWKSQRIQGIPD